MAFFMRNGADCLSKWVGEAERQLRVTFEQVRNHRNHTTAAIPFPHQSRSRNTVLTLTRLLVCGRRRTFTSRRSSSSMRSMG